jgi:hypothetical protein
LAGVFYLDGGSGDLPDPYILNPRRRYQTISAELSPRSPDLTESEDNQAHGDDAKSGGRRRLDCGRIPQETGRTCEEEGKRIVVGAVIGLMLGCAALLVMWRGAR